MLCFSQIVNFENWEILVLISVFSNEPEQYNTAKTDLSEVKFLIFEETF
jgi:hypothetical protein